MLIVILIDALRFDYINKIDTPFLFEKSKKGLYCKHLKTINGFSQRTVICTGAQEEVTNTFSMFNIDYESSPFNQAILKQTKKINNLKIIHDMLPSKRLKHRIRKKISTERDFLRNKVLENAKRKVFSPSLGFIPNEILPFIAMGEDNKSPIQKNGFPVESIFDILIDSNKSFEYLMYPIFNLEDDRIQMELVELINKNEKEFILCQFSNVDYVGHIYGPESYERRKAIAEIDRKLRELEEISINNDINFLIFGDHGMTTVNESIDLQEIVTSYAVHNKLIHGRDYVLFLDSTVMRIKTITKEANSLIEYVRKHSLINSKGLILDDLGTQMPTEVRSKLYGDLFWKANEGVLIHPDYFHKNGDINKGMHGYGAEIENMDSLVIGYGKSFKKQEIDLAYLYDICPTMCDLLKIRIPSNNSGKSLLT